MSDAGDINPTDAQDDRLFALFDKIEEQQLDFLDQANQRVIELCTAMLGLLFAIAAFGEKFPPAYISANAWAKWCAISVVAFYMAALVAAVFGVQPRSYRRYEYNVTQLRKELDRMRGYKKGWFRFATILFVLGSLALAALLAMVLWHA